LPKVIWKFHKQKQLIHQGLANALPLLLEKSIERFAGILSRCAGFKGAFYKNSRAEISTAVSGIFG
jgi:hypothetical protein